MPFWTAAEIRTLREVFPAAPWPEVERALPRHTPRAIRTRAVQEGLRRLEGYSKQAPTATGIPKLLRERRIALGKTQGQVAIALDMDRSQFVRMERRGTCTLFNAQLWAEVLGLEIVLREAQAKE